MAENNPQKIYYYHADANPIGGFITRPFSGFIPSHASSSLPVVGGFIEKQRKGRKWKDTVSFTNEATHVSGSKKDEASEGPWTTQVSATIDGLNILDVITADRVVAQLSVSHPHHRRHAKVSIVGSQFINLRISGNLIEPVIKYDLFTDHDGTLEADPKNRYPTKPWPQQEKFLEKVKAQKDGAKATFAKKYNGAPIPDWAESHVHWPDSDQEGNGRDFIVCSLIDQLPELPKNFPAIACGNVLRVPDFGKIYFAELIVTHHQYRLSMIRAQLGSPVGGAVSAAMASANGKPSGP